MDPVFHSAIAALLGAATGALTSVATSWVAQRHQQRTQWMLQERTRRERIFSEFIDQAAKAFVDALSHMSVEDPSKLVPLYATIGRLRLFFIRTHHNGCGRRDGPHSGNVLSAEHGLHLAAKPAGSGP